MKLMRMACEWHANGMRMACEWQIHTRVYTHSNSNSNSNKSNRPSQGSKPARAAHIFAATRRNK